MKKTKKTSKRYVPELMYVGEHFCGTSYTISNIEVRAARRWWRAKNEEFAVPPLRIVEAPGCLSEVEMRPLLEFVTSEDGNDDGDPDPMFADNYADAIFGKLDGWRLHAVEISTNDVGLLLFMVVNKAKHDDYQVVKLDPTFPMKIMFETEDKKGRVTRYLYEVKTEGWICTDNPPKLLKVTEKFGTKHPREVYFRIEGWFEPEHIGDNCDNYWLVREYR